MHLLRCVVFYTAVFHFNFVGEHVAGIRNTAADALSQNNLALFSSLLPQVSEVPILQPVLELLELLVNVRPNLGSHDWTVCIDVGFVACVCFEGLNCYEKDRKKDQED